MDLPTRAAAWDASLYDAKHAFVWKHGEAVVDLLAPGPGERILDLGCGTGHLTARIADAGAEVVGIDASPEMIEQARREHPGLRFEVADARTLRDDSPFDAVFSNAALHWIPEADDVAERIHAALKPDGRFVAEFGGRGNVQAIVSALKAASLAVAGRDFAYPLYFPSIADYATVLQRHGLETRWAALFDRPTPLDGEDGLRRWVRMFAPDVLAGLPADLPERLLDRVEAELEATLYREGRWQADYRRLRIVAARA